MCSFAFDIVAHLPLMCGLLWPFCHACFLLLMMACGRFGDHHDVDDNVDGQLLFFLSCLLALNDYMTLAAAAAALLMLAGR